MHIITVRVFVVLILCPYMQGGRKRAEDQRKVGRGVKRKKRNGGYRKAGKLFELLLKHSSS